MSFSARQYARYLTVSPQDRQWDLYVTAIGWAREESEAIFRTVYPEPYRFTWQKGRIIVDYAALYVTQGEGEFETEATGCKTVTAGTVLLLFPGVWHRYRPRETTGWVKYSVAFNGGYAKRLEQRKFISRDKPILDTGLDDAILRPYLSLLDLMQSERDGLQPLLAAHALEALAAILAAAQTRRQKATHNSIVREAKRFLEHHPEEIVDMESPGVTPGPKLRALPPRLHAADGHAAVQVPHAAADQPGQAIAGRHQSYHRSDCHRVGVR